MKVDEHDDPPALTDALRAMRGRYDGEHPDPEATLRRALRRTREGERKRRITRWTLLPIAAALVAEAAWAGMTGRLRPSVDVFARWVDPPAETTPAPKLAAASAPMPVPTPAPMPAPSAREPTPADPTTAEGPASTPVRDLAPAPKSVTAPTPASKALILNPPTPAEWGSPVAGPASQPSPAAAASSPPPAPSAGDPNAALFAEANRLHFIDKDPARALVAWERYLAAAPNGRFAPEARYNHALTLLRLGRRSEAASELAVFASGAYGNYRHDEARALLDALSRDAAP